MSIKKIYLALACCFLLFACTGRHDDWHAEYGSASDYEAHDMISEPADLAAHHSAVWNEEYEGLPKIVAVLLPLTGHNGVLGTGIQHSIEIAFFQNQPRNVLVSFNDLSGSREQKEQMIEHVVSRQPDIILGPIFSEDVELLRRAKPDRIPALTFTSDASALGNGIFTMALLPNQAVESIVQRMALNNHTRLLILAPNTRTGHMLANGALDSAGVHKVQPVGLYYYHEGDMSAMKVIAEKAAMFRPRENAHREAKDILADALMTKHLGGADKASAVRQLDSLNKTDTVGRLPYDAVLFLGGAHDSKALASFLRYYDVPTNTVKFYGTAMWDSDTMFGDVTMNGSEFASLPAISKEFSKIYEDIEGISPNRMNTMGYDAAMIAIGAMSGKQSPAAHLLSPSGFKGLDGLFRLRPNGTNERALQTMLLNASGTPRMIVPAATSFKTPLYQTRPPSSRQPHEIELQQGFNALEFVQLPAEAKRQYRHRTTTYRLAGAGGTPPLGTNDAAESNMTTMLPEDDSDAFMSDPDFQPGQFDTIDRRIIEDVEIRVRNAESIQVKTR